MLIILCRNLTGDDGYFKEKELDNMEKKIAEVEKWRDDKVKINQNIAPIREVVKREGEGQNQTTKH